MKKELTQERLKELLSYDPETGVFRWKRAHRKIKVGDIAGSIHVTGYRQIKVDGQLHKAHRLAWLYIYGQLPKNQLDHKHGWREDCRLVELREATPLENARNCSIRSDNTSGYKGVNWSKANQAWCARISLKRKRISMGHFSTAIEASRVYEEAAKKYFGEFRRAV